MDNMHSLLDRCLFLLTISIHAFVRRPVDKDNDAKYKIMDSETYFCSVLSISRLKSIVINKP